MYFFVQVLFKVFFNYFSGVISLWLMDVPFILPTRSSAENLVERDFLIRILFQVYFDLA